MDRHYSTLELVKFDDTVRAPERDHDATAFELDTNALAPQISNFDVIPDTTPEVFYNTTLPEAHGNLEETTKELGPTYQTVKPTLKRSWVMIALTIATAIAIGVGVGTWRHRQHSSNKSSYILHDTSLAALALANGDRYLFFQDNAGLIRHAIRTASNGQWTTIAYLNVSSNPKKHTPLAVLGPDDTRPELPTYDDEVALYYVSESHALNGSLYTHGFWKPNGMTLENYTAAVETRSLAVTPITIGNNSVPLLFYENSDGTTSALVFPMVEETDETTGHTIGYHQWLDITSLPGKLSSTLYKSDFNATLSPPFTSGNLSNSTVGALFYAPSNPDPSSGSGTQSSGGSWICAQYDIGPIDSGNSSALTVSAWSEKEVRDQKSIHQSDIAIFGAGYAMWVNGTQPVVFDAWDIGTLNPFYVLKRPNNAFPFARLASATTADQSTTFLYHQMSDTTIVEEQWDASLGNWISSQDIVVSDLNSISNVQVDSRSKG